MGTKEIEVTVKIILLTGADLNEDEIKEECEDLIHMCMLSNPTNLPTHYVESEVTNIEFDEETLLLKQYQQWEHRTLQSHGKAPHLFNYEPTGSPDVENELQFQVREEGEQVEFFQIGYSEEENNFYFNHNQFDGNVVYRTSEDATNLHLWMEEVNQYEPM